MEKRNITIIEIEDVKKQTNNYKYGLIYEISRVLLNSTENIGVINWDELQEAYFFDENGVIHVFDDGEKMTAIKFIEENIEHTIEKTYDLTGKYKESERKVLVVREYLNFDSEDGQSYVEFTRPFCLR